MQGSSKKAIPVFFFIRSKVISSYKTNIYVQMPASYTPPFSITDEMINRISSISRAAGRLESGKVFEKNPHLRRSNRIHSIHSSLTIEGSRLTLSEVTDIINGKPVAGEEREIRAVKNAVRAYNRIDEVNPYSLSDLLSMHKTMMDGLVNHPGEFRYGGAGVFRGNACIHMAPPAMFVHSQVEDLLVWCKEASVHPLIKSSVFHFEFEFIHPFEDGNGRMGRLWQTVMLAHWDPVFAWLPIESVILSRQDEYYNALNLCGKSGNSTAFIEFMLKAIDDELLLREDLGVPGDTVNDTANDTVNVRAVLTEADLSVAERAVLACIESDASVTILKMAERTGYSRPTVTRALGSLKEKGWIVRVGSDKKGLWKSLRG